MTTSSILEPIDFRRFEGRIEDLRVSYANAIPWHHVLIDDFLKIEVAEQVLAAIPNLGILRSRLAKAFGARSYRSLFDECNNTLEPIFDFLGGSRFTELVERITSIDGLVADSKRVGAGLHQGASGSHLRIHADHNTHPDDPSRFRRINLLIYLNRTWQDSWNGDLELWDRDASKCVTRVSPKFNRCVILGVDDTAYHGYGPLRMPSGEARNALATYYYGDRPAAGQSMTPHLTKLPILPNESYLTRVSYRLRGAAEFRIKGVLGIHP